MKKNPWTDRDVEAHWDKVAGIYVNENNKVKGAHDQRFRESMQNLQLEAGMKVLNITSRDAEANDYILKENSQVSVINAEISAGLMKVAAKIRPEAVQVKLENYADLPFNNKEFNRVLSLETLEHVANPVRFLEELHRVSTDDARLVLSCPPATSELPYQLYTALFGGHGEGPHRFLPSKEVKEMFRESKWKLLVHKGTLLVPVGPGWLKQAGENFIGRMQGTFIAELGIRQFFVCEKA
jgi:cyclopropane fatty-acyl-phospholipid synthase-like methyltransferase